MAFSEIDQEKGFQWAKKHMFVRQVVDISDKLPEKALYLLSFENSLDKFSSNLVTQYDFRTPWDHQDM